MSKLAWLADKLAHRKTGRATSRHLASLAAAPVRASRRTARDLLLKLANEPGPHVRLGDTTWGEPVAIPLRDLICGSGIITGGTGAGKSMSAALIIQKMIELMPQLRSLSFGLIDPKRELFDRALFFISQRLQQLEGREREAFLKRITVIDFSSQRALTPYNVFSPWEDTETDFFVSSRLEILRELLPAGEKLSLRGTTVLKNVITLLVEFRLPITFVSRVLDSEPLRAKLLARTRNPEVRLYFGRHFAQESKQTIAALRVRMDSLCASVRLPFSGSTAPDFRRLQSEGRVVLVNCSGTAITRGIRQLLQNLLVADIRQSIFARQTPPAVNYLWFIDEAQTCFAAQQQQENILDILTMGRSFGTQLCALTQNAGTAIPDARILESLHTNIKWAVSLRGSPRDAQFLRSALPITGRRLRPEGHPYRERTTYSPEEERSLALEGIAHLPDRTAYLLLKARNEQAIMIRTKDVALPEGDELRRVVEALREEPSLGGRVGREEYERMNAERDREWLAEEEQSPELGERLERKYQQESAAWRA